MRAATPATADETAPQRARWDDAAKCREVGFDPERLHPYAY
jgi:hypothetical protein